MNNKQSTAYQRPVGQASALTPDLAPLLSLLEEGHHLVLVGPFGVGKDIALNGALELREANAYVTPRMVQETMGIGPRAVPGTENDVQADSYRSFRQDARKIFPGRPTACILYAEDPINTVALCRPEPAIIEAGHTESTITLTVSLLPEDVRSQQGKVDLLPVAGASWIRQNIAKVLHLVKNGTRILVLNQNRPVAMLVPPDERSLRDSTYTGKRSIRNAQARIALDRLNS